MPTRACAAVHDLIRAKKSLSFDEVCAMALSFPTVQIVSVREWVLEIADFESMGPRERAAKLDAGHRVKLRAGKGQTGELDFGK